MGNIKTNSLQAWVLAARPKTLPGAAAPVIIGGAYAWMRIAGEGLDSFDWTVLGLCMLFAWIMQIDANFVNDYFDFRKGGDTAQRLGPQRACAQGWITPNAMKAGIAAATVLACAAGLPLIWTGGPWMLAVGILCVIFCFLYTTMFSRAGLGDLLVLVFFGIVPVGFTFFLQTGTWNIGTTLAGLGCGMAVDCLLMVNNYRDRDEDRANGKKTIVVRLGSTYAIILYYLLGLCATMLCTAAIVLYRPAWHAAPLLLYAALHLGTSRRLSVTDGAALNPFLGKTSRNFFLLSVLFCLSCI